MAQSKPDETPMMRQFYSLKEKHPDAVLLFRCGDFYETYAQDAVEAAEILGITLTRRNNGKNGAMALEMAGFPHHALDGQHFVHLFSHLQQISLSPHRWNH